MCSRYDVERFVDVYFSFMYIVKEHLGSFLQGCQSEMRDPTDSISNTPLEILKYSQLYIQLVNPFKIVSMHINETFKRYYNVKKIVFCKNLFACTLLLRIFN